MKRLIISAACAIMLLASGCSTSRYMEARSVPINDIEIFAMPKVATLEVEPEHKTWVVTVKRKDAIAMGLNVNNMRAYALAVACKDGNPDAKPVYDAILGAVYVVKSSGKRYELEVTGFPAKYTGFRDMESKDIEILKFSGQGQSEIMPVNADEASKFNIFKK